jgi:gluconokinase
MLVVVMGVSGVGKSTVGAALAAALGCTFVDGDDLHPAANVAKMKRGEPLDDHDRAPWLAAIAARMQEALATGESLVVACSALKRDYRRVLRVDGSVEFVLLTAPAEILRQRLEARRHHFMPASLLPSQLATLEPPEPDELIVDTNRPLEEVVRELQRELMQ